MNDPARRARLNAIKLTALVRDHLGGSPVLVPDEFSGGAALHRGEHAWVLLDQRPEHGLGAALGWALRRGATELHIVAESATGLLARRAAGFSLPITVWHAEGRTLAPAVAEPLTPSAEAPAHHLQFVDTIVASGAIAAVEHGVLSGEVEGLEVCRVVDDRYTGEVRLEVGVGAHDRDAFQMMHGNRPTAEALAVVVDAVVAHRRPLDASHPLGRLAHERALRSRIVASPSLVGATEVRVVPPPVPRQNLKDPVPCLAIALVDGEAVLVVCSTGVDLDVVPFAVDARLALGIERCIIVMPARDRVAVQVLLAAAARPAVDILSEGSTP
ncbi:MAG: hypothetical protein WCI22_07375 [Actinomycetota bacterium]